MDYRRNRNAFAPGGDSDRELEAEGDCLLKSAGALGRHTGIYTAKQLRRKVREELRRMHSLEEGGVCPDVIEYLAQARLEDLIAASRLTAVQESVLRLRAVGLSCRDIAVATGVRHEVLAGHLRQARSKVRAAIRQGRYAGWYEVYVSEVNRPAYRARCRIDHPEY